MVVSCLGWGPRVDPLRANCSNSLRMTADGVREAGTRNARVCIENAQHEKRVAHGANLHSRFKSGQRLQNFDGNPG
jgi:hypothetical protein